MGVPGPTEGPVAVHVATAKVPGCRGGALQPGRRRMAAERAISARQTPAMARGTGVSGAVYRMPLIALLD